jgi:hypothetical protein
MAGKKLKQRNLTKFNVPCAFGGQASEVAIYVGAPEAKHNPIYFQSKFIQDVRGGVIPSSVIESLEKLQKLSLENGVAFEELCRYALNSLNSSSDTQIATTDSTDGALANIEDTKATTDAEVSASTDAETAGAESVVQTEADSSSDAQADSPTSADAERTVEETKDDNS